MKGCVAEQKVSDWQMNAWTLRACDIVRACKVWRVTSIKNFVDWLSDFSRWYPDGDARL